MLVEIHDIHDLVISWSYVPMSSNSRLSRTDNERSQIPLFSLPGDVDSAMKLGRLWSEWLKVVQIASIS